MKNKTINLNIVIPTLGESSLLKCVNSILNSSFVPSKIIIVIPNEYYSNLDKKILNNPIIKIIKTEFQGQVIQRIQGFKIAKSKYIMQLDSDIILNYNSIKQLYLSVRGYNFNFAVAPLLLPNKINNSYKNKNLISKIKKLILNGNVDLQPGQISDIGYNTWFESKELIKDVYSVKWLPGGCIFYNKKSLILKNYYPYKGKAYCEDIIHSIELQQNNTCLFLFPKIKVKNIGYIHKKNRLYDLLREFRIRYHILKIIKGSKLRFFIWYILHVIR